MTKSWADRLLAWGTNTQDASKPELYSTEFYAVEKGVRALEAENARYKYTPQAYDEMWDRLIKAVNENDKLKAQLEDCAAVNAEVIKKVARLEKSINNQEADSN